MIVRAESIACCALFVLVQSSAAAKPCSELDNPVYVTGSSAAKPFLA